ncbi:MAG TPA: hypothetical protein VFS53_01300 [Gemmatimonadota bacterium]|nr:hypothetical protein [Gemmatimonadota bacterium]
MVAGAAAIAFLRTLLVPVGSFRDGLASLAWGMPADSVVAILGEPNRICTSGDVDHVPVAAPDSANVRRALRAGTAERWVYTRRGGRRPVPRDSSPGCRAPSIATELGFDARGRLAWYVREMDQTDLRLDPALVGPAVPRE